MAGELRELRIFDEPEGVPAANWCLVRVAGRDLRGLENRANVTPLPDVSLDVKLSSIRTQTYEAFQNRLAARYNVAPNVSAQGSSSHAVRDLIEGLARRLNPDFSANNFDLPDVA